MVTLKSKNHMKRARKTEKTIPAEAIARLADSGGSVSKHFTNTGKMVRPVQRVNVDFSQAMLRELDEAAAQSPANGLPHPDQSAGFS